jgi:hypothetical protein
MMDADTGTDAAHATAGSTATEPPEPPVPTRAGGPAWSRRLAVGAALLAWLAFAFMGSIDGVTATYRVPGTDGAAVSSYTPSPTNVALTSPADLTKAVQGWVRFGQAMTDPVADPLHSGYDLAKWYFIAQLVFIAATTLVLVGLRVYTAPPTDDATRRLVVQNDRLLAASTEVTAKPWFAIGIAVAFGCNLVSTLLTWLEVRTVWPDGTAGWPVWVAQVLGAIGSVLVLALALPFVLRGLVVLVRHAREVIPSAWFPLLAAGALVVLVRNDQAADAFRRMGAFQYVVAFMLAVATGIMLALAASRAADRRSSLDMQSAPERPKHPLSNAVKRLWPLALIAAGLVVIGLPPITRGFVVPGALLLAAFALSLPVDWQFVGTDAIDNTGQLSRTTESTMKVAGTIGGSLAMIVAVGAIQALATDPLPRVSDTWTTGLSIVLLTIAAPLVAFGTYHASTGLVELLDREDAPGHVGRRIVVAVGVAALVGTIVAMNIDPGGRWSAGLSALNVVLLFVLVLGSIAFVARAAGDYLLKRRITRAWSVPASLRAVGFRRPPILVLLVLWAVVGHFVGQGLYHDDRQLTDTQMNGATWQAVRLPQRWTDWTNKNETARQSMPTPDHPFPILVVATSGGGIRSAYWTDAVLDCIIERTGKGDDLCAGTADPKTQAKRWQSAFAMSGVSGGSLGLTEYLAHHETTTDQPTWYDQVLGDDYLSPTMTRWLFRDAANTLVRDQDASGIDRADALEEAWEGSWTAAADRGQVTLGPGGNPMSAGFFAGQSSPTADEPLTLLNGYSITDGCRVNISILKTQPDRSPAPADASQAPTSEQCTTQRTGADATQPAVIDSTLDLTDGVVCQNGDLRRSTAAGLSARFPFVTPSAWLRDCDAADLRALDVDGGYLDTSGASPITQLWPTVESLACPTTAMPSCAYVPVYIQIDNDRNDALWSPPKSDPNEATVPIDGTLSGQGGVANASRMGAQRLFSSEGRWLHVIPVDHPGPNPPLGWVLSDNARSDLRQQLQANATQIRLARCYLDHPDALAAPAGSSTSPTACLDANGDE